MKKFFLYLIISSLWVACSQNNKDEIDCALYDPPWSHFYMKFVDSEGNNLITNGSIHPDSIHVEIDSRNAYFQLIPVNPDANPDSKWNAIENTIEIIDFPAHTKGNYMIYLNSQDSIPLEVTMQKINMACGYSITIPLEATYKNKELEFIELNSTAYLAELEW